MIHSKKETTEKELRNFGLLVGAVFGLIACWPVFWGNPLRIWAAAVFLLLTGPAIVKPAMLQWPYRCWMTVGSGLGWVNTRVILATLYFAAVMPVGLLLRLLGRTPLKLHFDPSATSYRELPEENESNVNEQF
ncbi:MAG TPA: SxtJ family membrane protein [Candidatus Rifleibacterium sp.]|nr:SxtJ family membrane protein [Candidatus Rifleibacterium sp.]